MQGQGLGVGVRIEGLRRARGSSLIKKCKVSDVRERLVLDKYQDTRFEKQGSVVPSEVLIWSSATLEGHQILRIYLCGNPKPSTLNPKP